MQKHNDNDLIDHLINISKLNCEDNSIKPCFDNYLENKNGLFLSYVHHDEEDLNSYVTLVRSA